MNPIGLLVLACLGLFIGPLCSLVGTRFKVVESLLDGFALALVGCLCVIFVLPHTVAEIGMLGLGMAVVGMFLPWVFHRFWHGKPWSLGLVGLVLAIHVLLDGAVLAVRDGDMPLGWAVVAHRLPVGFAIVVATGAGRKSQSKSWGLVLAMVAATVLGYFLGPGIVSGMPHSAPAALEALAAGVLLHVVFVPHSGSPDDYACHHHGSHGHDHDGAHDHGHDHGHGVLHGLSAPSPERQNDHGHEHGHQHDCGHDHIHGHDCGHDHAHQQEHAHDHHHECEHKHDHGHDCAHDHDHQRVGQDAHAQEHAHGHGHVEGHEHEHAGRGEEGEGHGHDHAHESAHEHGHEHDGDHDHKAEHAHGHECDHKHDHGHDCSHDHVHGHEANHDHGHQHACQDAHGHGHEHSHNGFVEDHHKHDHGYDSAPGLHGLVRSHSHSHDHGGEPGQSGKVPARWWSAVGAVCGVLVVIAGMLFDSHDHDEGTPAVLETLGVLVLESAPALLLGYGLAGVIPFLLTPTGVNSLSSGGKLMQSLRGVAFGLPLPVCSCGVLPLYESLIRRGAPPAAAMAFFVATPELGLDAVLLSVPLLGSSLTVARVVAAFVVALLVALLVGGRPGASTPRRQEAVAEANSGDWGARMRSGLRFGFVEVFDHTMPWIALGLVVAAMAEPMLSHGAIDHVPWFLQVPIAALVGVPVYVCASGATPIAALALHKGLSTGAAIAFLIAGPATNVTTFGVLARLHGRRMALQFGVAVTVLAILAGWAVDMLEVPAAPVLDDHAHAEEHGSWFAWACVVGLALLTLSSVFRQGPRGALQQILEPIHSH